MSDEKSVYRPWMDKMPLCDQLLAMQLVRTPQEIEADQRRDQEMKDREQANMANCWADNKSKVVHVDKYTEYIEVNGSALYKKTCPVCGDVFYTYNDRKVYDCTRCQIKCSNEKQKQKHIDARTNLICEQCGKLFDAARRTKFCCSACRQKAYRSRSGKTTT